MKFFKIFLISAFSLILLNCSGKPKTYISGKWKVNDTGIKGMEVFYEFRSDTIIIESRMEKFLADSLGEISYKSIKELYSVKSDSASFLLLEVTNTSNQEKGEYKIKINNDSMTLIDFQGAIINFTKQK